MKGNQVQFKRVASRAYVHTTDAETYARVQLS